MTSKLVVNTIEADTGISSVSFASSISISSTSKFFFGAAGIDIGADTNINRPAAGVLGFNINGTEKVRITSDAKVGIGEDPTISQFQVKTAQLGGTAGNTQEVVRLHSPDVSNTTSYRFTNYRTSNGTSHVTSELRFRRHVDSTDMGYFGLGDQYVSIGYGTAEKLRIDSTGALGLGITPKNNSGNYRQLQIGLGAHFYGRTDDTPIYLVSNGYRDGSDWKYTANTTASQIAMGTNIVFSNAASGTAGNAISFSERLRINSNGSLQVTPEGSTSNPYMLIDTSGDSVRFNAQKASGNNEFRFLTQSSGSVTEKLRITSGGQIFIGGNTGYNESSSLISFATDSSAGANMLSDSSAIYNHNNPAFLHIQNRYNTGTGQEAGIILHSRSSHNGSWAMYGKRTGSSYLSDLIFRNRTASAASAERLRIHSTGQVTKPASCAFNVTPNGNQSLGSGETLTSWKTTDSRGFENTTTGGYFGSGIFTAPVTGAYYFTSNILLYDTNGTNSIHLYWQKNGSGTHTYWNTRFNSGDFGYGNFMPVAGACTMYMSAGDTCRIRISFSGSNCGMYGNDQNWGNWGGFLIG